MPHRCRLTIVVLVPALVAVIAFCRSASAEFVAPLGNAQPLNVPQAANGTFAVGLSDGNVVGGYYGASNLNHGFLFNGSSFTPLDFPGSKTTTVSGISGQNLVGSFTDAANASHGFLYNGQNWTTIDDPAGNYTVADGVSGNKVVGYFSDGTKIQGFLYDSSHSLNPFTTLDDPTPGTQKTVAFGIDGTGIVGYFMAGNHVHGFSYVGGSYTTLDFPGSISTAAYGISGGNIVGAYQDSSGSYHGFLYDGTDWTALNVGLPGAISTQAYGISGNQVVGEYVDASLVDHGFIVTIPEPSSVVRLASGALTAAVIALAAAMIAKVRREVSPVVRSPE
jgi:hypothetical protein